MSDKKPERREFLFTASYAVGAVGLGAVVWPLVDQMNPDASVKALASTEVDVSSVKPGNTITVLWRGKPVFIRRRTQEEISEANNKVIVATYGVAAVGINIPRIFNLVLIEPGKSFVRVIQSIGRGIRKAEDKDFVQIWDITSSCRFAKRHLTQRKHFYREANYPFVVEKLNYK